MVRPITAWLDSEGTLHMTEAAAVKAQACINLKAVIETALEEFYFTGMCASEITTALMLHADTILEVVNVTTASRSEET